MIRDWEVYSCWYSVSADAQCLLMLSVCWCWVSADAQCMLLFSCKWSEECGCWCTNNVGYVCWCSDDGRSVAVDAQMMREIISVDAQVIGGVYCCCWCTYNVWYVCWCLGDGRCVAIGRRHMRHICSPGCALLYRIYPQSDCYQCRQVSPVLKSDTHKVSVMLGWSISSTAIFVARRRNS